MSNQTSPVLFESFHLIPPYAIGVSGGEIRDLSLTVKSTSSEVIMNGPGMVNAEASLKIQPKKSLLDYNGIDVTVRFVLSSIDLDSSINITALLRQEQPFDINVDNIGQALNDKGRWFLVSQSVSYQNH